jgi:hypothetical protein
MAAPSVTYTFTNGTTADATQVNTNFTDLINGASDGTKDYTINALVVGGAATFNGAMTLGNASGDAITVTGSLASSVAVSANATYNIGGSTTGLLSVYLGNNTRTVRLLAGTLTGSYTITLPPATAAAGQLMVFNSSSTAEFRYADKFAGAKTANYTATGDETIIPCSCSVSSFTVTLPAASTMTGKQLKIIRTDSDLTRAVTIDANGSETIDGATTTTLNTQYECVTIACDGSNWHVINRKIPSVWTAYTPGTQGFGTIAGLEAFWRRDGDSIDIRAYFASGTTTSTEARLDLPSGLTSASSSKIVTKGIVGNFQRNEDVAAAQFLIMIQPSVTYLNFVRQSAGFIGNAFRNGDEVVSNTTVISIQADGIPISGWAG